MHQFMFLLFLSILFACGNTEPAATTESPAPQTTQEAPQSATQQMDHPCDAIGGEEVAAAFDWPGSNDPMRTTMSKGRLQSCYYTNSAGIGASTITISQSSERTIERKGLEATFAADLTKEDDRFTWSELPEGPGDQTLYGSGKNGPNHTYILRWRSGNEVEFSVDYSSSQKQDAEAMKAVLMKLAQRL